MAETTMAETYYGRTGVWPKRLESVSTFTIDLVFENYFLSAMAPYVYSRDGRSLSIYGSECQI